MEFRDIIATGSLTLTLLTFMYNWLSARRWQQKVAMRDELARFATDDQVRVIVNEDARTTAEHAAVYLSLELAEAARQKAARRASRASGSFLRAAVGYGILLLIGIPIFLTAAFLGWDQRDSVSNFAGAAYFIGACVFFVVIYVRQLRLLKRVQHETRELKSFRDEVVRAKPLTARDVKMSRPKSGAGGRV